MPLFSPSFLIHWIECKLFYDLFICFFFIFSFTFPVFLYLWRIQFIHFYIKLLQGVILWSSYELLCYRHVRGWCYTITLLRIWIKIQDMLTYIFFIWEVWRSFIIYGTSLAYLSNAAVMPECWGYPTAMDHSLCDVWIIQEFV